MIRYYEIFYAHAFMKSKISNAFGKKINKVVWACLRQGHLKSSCLICLRHHQTPKANQTRRFYTEGKSNAEGNFTVTCLLRCYEIFYA